MNRNHPMARVLVAMALAAGVAGSARASLFCQDTFVPGETTNGDCGDGSFLIDLINTICQLAFDDGTDTDHKCASRCQSCMTGEHAIARTLFTGHDGPMCRGGTEVTDELGDGGQAMQNAALCLLRDLVNAAQGNTDEGAGIRIRHGYDLGLFGNLEVRQQVSLLDVAPDLSRIEAMHDVGFCLPLLGCIDHVTQRFAVEPRFTAAPAECSDDFLFGYGLASTSDDLESALGFRINNLLRIPTPFGDVTISPEFAYRTDLKTVRSPYGDPPQPVPYKAQERTGFINEFPNPPIAVPTKACLTDVSSISDGLAHSFFPSAALPACRELNRLYGFGWDSDLGLGGRDADPPETPDTAPWNEADGFPRPDFLSGFTDYAPLSEPRARVADERAPVGEARASADVKYDAVGLIPKALRDLPFLTLKIKELSVTVTPKADVAFASQFLLSTDSAEYFREKTGADPIFAAGPNLSTVRLESGGEAKAAVVVNIKVVFEFTIEVPLPFVPNIHIRLDPEFPIGPFTTPSMSFTGPVAAAELDKDAANFRVFRTFSRPSEATDGNAFVRQCLEAPPPPPESPPAPTFKPPDPVAWTKVVQFPCNFCVDVPQITAACQPITPLPPGYECPQTDRLDPPLGESCLDLPLLGTVCRYLPLDPPLPGPGKHLLFPASQGSLPSNKRWSCDDPTKTGCFDLCTYDSTAAVPLHVVTSAVDNPKGGARCALPPAAPPSCDSDSECDDTNPCTAEHCQAGRCVGMNVSGACDDGMFCDGPDTCVDGFCQPVGPNPCFADAKCCDERTDTCQTSCGLGAVTCADDGAPCDDANACTSDDRCESGLCRGTVNGLCTGTCGNGFVDPGEECDVYLDQLCPGACQTDCTCPDELCANSVDDDGDVDIDCEDTECQGRPCECLPIGRDPGRIRFGRPGHDVFKLHGTVTPCEPLDFLDSEVAGVLTNSQGVVASFTLPAGSLVQGGAHRFRFTDRKARATRTGLAQLRFTGTRNAFRFEFFGDLSKATEPEMTFQLRVGSHVFVNEGTWKEALNGWSLSLPGEK